MAGSEFRMLRRGEIKRNGDALISIARFNADPNAEWIDISNDYCEVGHPVTKKDLARYYYRRPRNTKVVDKTAANKRMVAALWKELKRRQGNGTVPQFRDWIAVTEARLNAAVEKVMRS